MIVTFTYIRSSRSGSRCVYTRLHLYVTPHDHCPYLCRHPTLHTPPRTYLRSHRCSPPSTLLAITQVRLPHYTTTTAFILRCSLLPHMFTTPCYTPRIRLRCLFYTCTFGLHTCTRTRLRCLRCYSRFGLSATAHGLRLVRSFYLVYYRLIRYVGYAVYRLRYAVLAGLLHALPRFVRLRTFFGCCVTVVTFYFALRFVTDFTTFYLYLHLLFAYHVLHSPVTTAHTTSAGYVPTCHCLHAFTHTHTHASSHTRLLVIRC